jgi:hypothetical protein
MCLYVFSLLLDVSLGHMIIQCAASWGIAKLHSYQNSYLLWGVKWFLIISIWFPSLTNDIEYLFMGLCMYILLVKALKSFQAVFLTRSTVLRYSFIFQKDFIDPWVCMCVPGRVSEHTTSRCRQKRGSQQLGLPLYLGHYI